MSVVSPPVTQVDRSTERQVVRLQVLTLVWMSIEVTVAIGASWHARSIALAGFGGDSLVEWASAALVFERFRRGSRVSEQLAARVAGSLLLGLGALVVLASVLSFLGSFEPRTSRVGIGLLLAAACFMPWLARQKRILARSTGSAALKADATQSSLCGYFAWIGLGGLLANAWWTLPWADAMAGLALVPFIVREGWSAIREARLCHDCC